ncbi:MAG: hypothetical protein ACKOA8_13460 [Deltaproteobacteria bacterium]
MKSLLFKKRDLRAFKFHILLLLLLEVLVISGWVVYKPLQEKIRGGFIVKNGKNYIVFWVTDERNQRMYNEPSLKKAIQFAQDELGLEMASDRLSAYPLEFQWLKNNVSDFTFYWKTMNTDFFNRLTFTSEEEAKLFQSMVLKGAYSPSPIGHALALFPSKKN